MTRLRNEEVPDIYCALGRDLLELYWLAETHIWGSMCWVTWYPIMLLTG